MSRLKNVHARRNRFQSQTSPAVNGKQSAVLKSLREIIKNTPTETPIICPDSRHALPLGRALVRFVHANRPSMPSKDIAAAVDSNTHAINRILENLYGRKQDPPEQDEKFYEAEKELMDKMVVWIRQYGESIPKLGENKGVKAYPKTKISQKNQKTRHNGTDDEGDDADENVTMKNGKRVLRSQTSKLANAPRLRSRLLAKKDKDSEDEDETCNSDSTNDFDFVKKGKKPSNSRMLCQRTSSGRSAAKRKRQESDEDESEENSDSNTAPATRNQANNKKRPRKKSPEEPESTDDDDAPPAPKHRKTNTRLTRIQSSPESSPEREESVDASEKRQRIYQFCSAIGYVPNNLGMLMDSGLGIEECRSLEKQSLEETKDILGQAGVLGQCQLSFFAKAVYNAKKGAWKLLK